jgi:Cu-processing system permease protein
MSLCAREELVLAARSRWTLIFAAVFLCLTMAVSASGYVLSGGSGLQDFSRTAASLLQLVLLLVPLTSLVVGVTSLTPEMGSAELLYSQPVRRHDVLAGKLAGLFAALVAAQAVGFGGAGILLFARTGSGGIATFGAVVVASATLTAVSLSLAAAIAAGRMAEDRARALSIAMVVWFVGVLLFDVAALGAASMLSSGAASRLLVVAAIVNPVDAIRTATLFASDGTSAFGAASLAFFRLTGGVWWAAFWLIGSVVVWIAAPLLVAMVRLHRADL